MAIRLSEIMDNVETTWAEQRDKESIIGIPFYIHHAKVSEYHDETLDRMASIIVLDITLRTEDRMGDRAVIVVGNTEDRAPIVNYFASAEAGERKAPIGPVHTFPVKLKKGGGQTFWRMENWSDELVTQYDMNGEPAATVRGKVQR